MRRRLLAATVAGIAAAVLTACGDMHPGAAVVIDDGDYRVSMEEVDDLAAAWCDAQAAAAQAQGQPSEASAGIDSRQYVVALLIQSYLTETAAADIDAEEPAPAELQLSSAELASLTEITDQMEPDQVDELIRILELSRANDAWQQSIGSEQPQANASNVAQLGQRYILDTVEDFDIDLDPRLGLDGDDLLSEEAPRSGSMSVAQSDQASMREDPERATEMVEALPPSQSCG